MNIFIVASTVVVFALLISLVYWYKIWEKGTSAEFKKGAMLYVVCFALYVIGQSLVIFQNLGVINQWYSLSSYLYALAAILFAIGSYFQYRSIRN